MCDAGMTRHLLFLIQTLCNELIACDRGRAFRCGSGPFETGIPRALTRNPPRLLRGFLTSPEPAGPRYIVMGGALDRLSLGPPPCSARLHYSRLVRVRVDPGAQPSRPCPYTTRSQPVSSRGRTSGLASRGVPGLPGGGLSPPPFTRSPWLMRHAAWLTSGTRTLRTELCTQPGPAPFADGND